MIISHKLKVIHIRLRKVAGSSFEVALSKYCGPDDVIAPIMGGGEAEKRVSLGFRGAQNYEDFMIRKRIGHLSAIEIKKIISPHIFDNYLKIAIIRNPYEKAISWYFWRKKKGKLIKVGKNFEKILSSEKDRLMDYELIHIDGKSAVDFVIRYEHLTEDIRKLETKIACPGLLETFLSINSKANVRPKQGASLYEVYSQYPKAKLMVEQMCYDNLDRYELLKEHWPIYKSELEHILANPPSG